MAPPNNYTLDPTNGANGLITPALFSGFGGVGTAAQAGFVEGYKVNYVDTDTEEGLTITVLQFKSPAKASKYLGGSAAKTLSFAAPTSKPFPKIPGALQFDGTKAYDGNFDHGVVMSRGDYYALMVYETTQQVVVPVEFSGWANLEYRILK
jgi:hypothetical protein